MAYHVQLLQRATFQNSSLTKTDPRGKTKSKVLENNPILMVLNAYLWRYVNLHQNVVLPENDKYVLADLSLNQDCFYIFQNWRQIISGARALPQSSRKLFFKGEDPIPPRGSKIAALFYHRTTQKPQDFLHRWAVCTGYPTETVRIIWTAVCGGSSGFLLQRDIRKSCLTRFFFLRQRAPCVHSALWSGQRVTVT